MDDFIIAQDPPFTVRDYKEAIGNSSDDDKAKIARAIKRKLVQRYINPSISKENKNGFSIMANCCLLIESFESFHRGWNKTPSGSDAFCKFFNRTSSFGDFTGNDTPTKFYKHIRCGILHQGETTGGWRIRRDMKQKVNLVNKIIDANRFRDALKNEIEEYFNSLEHKSWNSEEWRMIKKKMNSIIKNCES